MRHGFFLFFLIALIGLSGCKARKNTVRTSETATKTQTQTRSIDTARVVLEAEFHTEETQQIHETTDRETIHLDTLGRVRTIIRESVRTETRTRRNDRGQGSAVSVTGKTDSAATVEQTHQTGYRSDATVTDSRPVQGFEWFWVIVTGSLVLIAVIYVIIRKYNLVNRKL